MGRSSVPRNTLPDFASACRSAGVAATPQRTLIYSVLAGSEDHPTADEVHQRVRARQPGISLATVYRNLKLFAETGLIEEVATGSSVARYDANRALHHHLICKGCGRVADTYSDALPAVGKIRGLVDGFEIHDLRVNLLGLCPACRVRGD